MRYTDKKKPILYFIIPCYNEEDVLPSTAPVFRKKILELSEKISNKSRVVFINDGSNDKTWEIIKAFHDEDKIYSGICLKWNRGHQNALMDGLMWAMDKCDITISIDADLQDDIDVADEMIEKYLKGYGVVCGVRASRKKDSFLKRNTARVYYRILRMFCSNLIYDHADYRLLDTVSLQNLSKFHGDSIFLRGLVHRLGSDVAIVKYDRRERELGKSKYTIKKMLSLAIKGFECSRLEQQKDKREDDFAIGEIVHL